MTGTLFGLGVGPGDPELLTLKAARILQTVPVVTAPVSKVGSDSYALNIVSEFLQPAQTILKLHFPMLKEVAAKRAHRQAAAQTIAAELQAGRDVAFLTEGDPLLYSTFIYVLQYLKDAFPVEIVPGISSIMAAAAQAQLPLVNGGQRLAVLPTAFENIDDLRPILAQFETVVLLKVFRQLEAVLNLLDELGLDEQVTLVERTSHAEGRVLHGVKALRNQSIHYLSLMIIQTGK